MVNQGCPLSPITSNVVMESVLHHMVSLVEVVTRGQEGWVRELIHRAAFFKADDDPDVSTDPDWIQGVFDNLTGLFESVGVRTNTGKTVSMLCRP